ncbi:energy transducer TonB [Bacteroidota bacterium]
MFYRKSIKLSYLLSVSSHVVLILIFMLINFTIEHNLEEFVTVGFGTYGKMSSSGTLGNNSSNSQEQENFSKRVITRLQDKRIEVPLTQHTDTENIKSKRESEIEEKTQSTDIKSLSSEETTNDGKENNGIENGNFGFEIDFGGKGIRKIYSYSLPEYPEGVSKEIDVKLRFSILPDGTVGKIFPLIKADTRLEMAAIYSLRQWRFEPLRSNRRQVEQTAIIVFPYRLQ